VIIVTHDMGEAFALADRIGVIDEGQLIAFDDPETVAASPHAYVRRFVDAMPTIPRR
jgi:ABC-type proline/glycine betaine transport system ATPase subunit